MSDLPIGEQLLFSAVEKAYGDHPAVGQVATALAESDMVNLDQSDAYEVVDQALKLGILVEIDDDSLGGVGIPDSEPDSEDDQDAAGGEEATESEESDRPPAPAVSSWDDVDFAERESDVWPTAWLDYERFMTRKGEDKQPFSGWGDRDASVECSKHEADTTCAECNHDARYKWGYAGNYGTFKTARKYAQMDPRLSSDLVFIQREDDPFAFVDGDDVINPETGKAHPEFKRILNELGVSYADISQSNGGSHVLYRGSLPDGVKQAVFEIDDESWGSHDEDDLPTVEIYDGKHVNVATGNHVVDTGQQIREWDDDALDEVLNKYDQLRERQPREGHQEFDAEDYEPSATSASETTDDIRDIYAALDRLDARDVAKRTIVREWKDPSTADDRAFIPIWAPADYDGTANFVNERAWTDDGTRGGYGPPAAMAAIDAGLVSDRDCPGAVSGETWWRAVEHLRELGFDIPELEDDQESDYETDPRELTATVDIRRAWDAAQRVTRGDLDGDPFEPVLSDADAFACPECGDAVDVVRAVAVAEGLVETCNAALDGAYPEAYERAREEYGAPLLRYYTVGDAVVEFEAVLDLKDEVDFFDFDIEALNSEITARDDEVSGDAVRTLDPAWRGSESGESVLVFENGTVWDADTELVLDSLRFVALDAGLIDAPRESVSGETFTTAWRLARKRYGAPLPRWDPAQDGARELTPMLPDAEDLTEVSEVSGVDKDALDEARKEVERLIQEAASEAGMPTVISSLPATGKTTGTVKTARNRPLSYLAPRKTLQKQALEKADNWNVDARILPVFADRRLIDEVLTEAVGHVRANGKNTLRNRWTIYNVVDNATDKDAIFMDKVADDEEDDVDLDRPTCETAEGEHGDAWALAVHVARALGYTPQEIHTQAEGLFGAELPCSHDDGEEDAECSLSRGWDHAADADNPADLLVGSYVHAHVESVRTYRERGPDGIEKSTRTVVLDEFPGEAFTTDFGEEAMDFATWLARSLRADIEDRRDMVDADLWGDQFVRDWLEGQGTDHESINRAATELSAVVAMHEAAGQAGQILDQVDDGDLEQAYLHEPLAAVYGGDDLVAAYQNLADVIEAAEVTETATGLISWAQEAVLDPLSDATDDGRTEPDPGAVDTDAMCIGSDLADLVERAVEAARDGEDSVVGLANAAVTALNGGAVGCRRLAAWANDGYAHPDAHHLLQGVITPTTADSACSGSRRVSTSEWAFDPDATDGTVVDIVDTGDRARVILDRNDHGAVLRTPPERTAGNGKDSPLLGLDATARGKLWSVALGEEVTTDDIHDTPAERAAFLEEALDLHVIQAAEQPRYYEGDPTTKDTDGDVTLLEDLEERYGGIQAPRLRGGEAIDLGNPAAITTKGVRNLLEDDDRLEDLVADWENYGNMTGANYLGEYRLAAILGCQHYGDHAVERFASLGGEEADTARSNGRGAGLDYGSDIANAYLDHMTKDQTMQAILRFTRGESGATVVARTSALRDDLPVVGRGQVVETWSETATKIAQQYRRLGAEFTAADVADAVDVTKRQVRRVLAELVEAGYLSQTGGGAGVAKTYQPEGAPGAGEVDLPDHVQQRGPGVQPGPTSTKQYYTWNVRVGDEIRELLSEAGGTTAGAVYAPPVPPG